MGCKGTCIDYKPHWVSNSLNSVGFCEKPARVGTDTLQYYTEISFFGHLCTPISRKPELSRHSRLCGLKVHPLYCKSHQVACSLNSVHANDRGTLYPTHKPMNVHVSQCFELKFPTNQSFPSITDLWAVKALVWTTSPTGSRTPQHGGVL